MPRRRGGLGGLGTQCTRDWSVALRRAQGLVQVRLHFLGHLIWQLRNAAYQPRLSICLRLMTGQDWMSGVPWCEIFCEAWVFFAGGL